MRSSRVNSSIVVRISLSLKFLKVSDYRIGISFFSLLEEVCVLFLVGCVFEEANGA